MFIKNLKTKNLKKIIETETPKTPFSMIAMVITSISITLSVFLFINYKLVPVNFFKNNFSELFLFFYLILNSIIFYFSFTNNINSSAIYNSGIFISIILEFAILLKLKNQLDTYEINLLFILSFFIVLLIFNFLRLRSLLGLLAFSFMVSFNFPLIFLTKSNFLNGTFLKNAIFLFLTLIFFMEPIFIQLKELEYPLNIFLGFILIISNIINGINIWLILNLFLIIFADILLVYLGLYQKYHLPTFSLLMFISIIFLINE